MDAPHRIATEWIEMAWHGMSSLCQSFSTNNKKEREGRAVREICFLELAKLDSISLMKIIMKTGQNKNQTAATEFGRLNVK